MIDELGPIELALLMDDDPDDWEAQRRQTAALVFWLALNGYVKIRVQMPGGETGVTAIRTHKPVDASHSRLARLALVALGISRPGSVCDMRLCDRDKVLRALAPVALQHLARGKYIYSVSGRTVRLVALVVISALGAALAWSFAPDGLFGLVAGLWLFMVFMTGAFKKFLPKRVVCRIKGLRTRAKLGVLVYETHKSPALANLPLELLFVRTLPSVAAGLWSQKPAWLECGGWPKDNSEAARRAQTVVSLVRGYSWSGGKIVPPSMSGREVVEEAAKQLGDVTDIAGNIADALDK